MRVQADAFFHPLSEHMQVLQPSAAMKLRLGQQRPCSVDGAGVGRVGASGQVKDVQLASSLRPLAGQMQLFNPSPAGKML